VVLVIDFDLQTRSVHLRSPGFESCIVTAPGWRSERPLRRFYERPSRATASVFVDELLALSLDPPRRPSEVRTLSASDRARLRRAVVVVCGCEREWKALYRSHLSLDERAFAMMLWRWHRQEQTRRLLQEQHRNHITSPLDSVAQDVARHLGVDVNSPAKLAEVALRGVGPAVDFSKYVSPSVIAATDSLVGRTTLAADILAGLGLPTLNVVESVKRTNSVFGDIERATQAAARAFDVGAASRAVGALQVASPFARYIGSGAASAPLAWTAPAGLAGMVSQLEQTTAAVQVFSALNVSVPAVSPGAWWSDLAHLWESAQSAYRTSQPVREMMEAVQTVDRFDRRWQQEALYFVLSGFLAVCSLWEMYELASLSRAEVEEAVLAALEDVVGDGQFSPALRGEVKRAPYLNESQRTNLDHALQHAAEGEYVHACASLYWGLEGAFWEVGYVQSAVTPDRKDPTNPNKSLGFESMVRRLNLEPELKTFMVRGLYGTTGNSYRHGGADSGERRQVLLGIAALAGWFEEFTSVPALTVLVTRTGRALATAVKRVRSTAPQLNP
jgi:hypothetical protein